MIKVAGKDVDLRKAMPLSIGDIRNLKKVGVDIMAMRPDQPIDNEQVLTLFDYVIRKADSSITQEQIDATPMTELLKWSQELQTVMPGPEPDPN
jgi:hypothetical protein